ncbi:MAG: Ca2+-dependent phosphoinositide-specific phospholipase C [Bacteroidota bacterium]
MKINQIQVLGTHNSYAQPIDTQVMSYVSRVLEPMLAARLEGMTEEQRAEYDEYHPNKVPMREALAYDHPALGEQLEAGMRSLEIDVFYDPTGNRFAEPASYRFLQTKGAEDFLPHDTTGMAKPGYKVLHIPDFDFRSHCPTFQDCLGELKAWSDTHPDHIPVFILLEIKQQGLPIFPQPTEVIPFDSLAFEALDKELLQGLGRNKLIIPDDVRGNFKTLEEGVLAQNWPLLKDARGKFVFLMLPAIDENAASLYWKGRPSLEGRMMFVRSTPGTPKSAFLLLDNAIVRQDEIKEYVKQGYLVRSRSDIETYEAKVNDKKRAEAAFTSGAQIISTDFFKPGNPYGTEYYVELPGKGVVRMNPVFQAEK